MIRSLQACRAAAALLVVLLHTSQGIFALPKYFDSRPFGYLFEFGGAGVDFFFVLSGFIIAHVHAGDVGRPAQLGSYLRKRLTRIYPVYWAAFLPLLPVYFLMPSFGTGREREPWTLVCSLLLIPQADGGPILGVAWSLCYELFFYGLFATLILSRRWGALLWAAWLTLVLVGLCSPFVAYPWTFIGGSYHVQFLAGVLVALLVKRARLPRPRLIAASGALVFLTTGMLEAHLFPQRTLGHLLGYLAGSALLLAGAIETERTHGLRVPHWLVFLGDASYSIYLTHFTALSLFAKAAKGLHLDGAVPAPLFFCLLACSATLTGCLFHVAIERPLLRWFRRRPAPVPVPAPPVVVAPVPRRRAA